MRLTQSLTLDSFSVFLELGVNITAIFRKSKKNPRNFFRGSFEQTKYTIQKH